MSVDSVATSAALAATPPSVGSSWLFPRSRWAAKKLTACQRKAFPLDVVAAVLSARTAIGGLFAGGLRYRFGDRNSHAGRPAAPEAAGTCSIGWRQIP